MIENDAVALVQLGRCAGKTKYALVDASSLHFLRNYAFFPKVDVDRNGNGVKIHAFVTEIGQPKQNGKNLHDVLWELFMNSIPSGNKVTHINGNLMDNRLNNLKLVDENEIPLDSKLIRDPHFFHQVLTCLLHRKQFEESAHLDQVNRDESTVTENFVYYECHFLPCNNLEQEMGQFQVCGRCRRVRYCCVECQHKDWPYHMFTCRQRNPVEENPLR